MYEIPVDKRIFEGKGYLKRFWTNLNENVHNRAPPYPLCEAGIRTARSWPTPTAPYPGRWNYTFSCADSADHYSNIGLLHKSWSLSSTFFPRLPKATTEVFLFYFYTISKSVFAAMWARWSDMLFSRKKFTRKHGRHGQTLKIYFSRTNWLFLTKTWGIIRELLFYPKHIFTDF